MSKEKSRTWKRKEFKKEQHKALRSLMVALDITITAAYKQLTEDQLAQFSDSGYGEQSPGHLVCLLLAAFTPDVLAEECGSVQVDAQVPALRQAFHRPRGPLIKKTPPEPTTESLDKKVE